MSGLRHERVPTKERDAFWARKRANYDTRLEDDRYWLFDARPDQLRVSIALFEPPHIMDLPTELRCLHPEYRGSASCVELDISLDVLPLHWQSGEFPDWLVILDYSWRS